MKFAEVIGQQIIKNKLAHFVDEGRMHHALLLHGKGGVGKLPLALSYAQYIHCQNKQNGDACGTCPSCMKHRALVHPDLHFVFPVIKDSSKKSISDSYLSDWREMINECPYFSLLQWFESLDSKKTQGMIYAEESLEIIRKLSLMTYESDYKVIIIAHADKMNISASNKLLKILEEPTKNTIFILTTEFFEDILPTIYSRCQSLYVPPIDNNVLYDYLISKFPENPAGVTSCLNICEGSLTYAKTCISELDKNSDKLNLFIDLMRCTYANSIADIFEWHKKVKTLSGENLNEFIEYVSVQIRNNYVITQNAKQISRLNLQENAFSEKFHRFINDKNIEGFYNAFEKALIQLNRNGSAQIILLDLAFQLVQLFKMVKTN